MVAVAMVMVAVISMVEAISTVEVTTAFALRISVARATSAVDPDFPARLRSETPEVSATR